MKELKAKIELEDTKLNEVNSKLHDIYQVVARLEDKRNTLQNAIDGMKRKVFIAENGITHLKAKKAPKKRLRDKLVQRIPTRGELEEMGSEKRKILLRELQGLENS